MKVLSRQTPPVPPLLRAYTEAGIPTSAELTQVPSLGSRFGAILAAADDLLNEPFVDEAAGVDFQTALLRFYEACVQPPLHGATLTRCATVVRHGIAHLLRGADALPVKLARCLSGSYGVAGLGPSFWSALVQGLDPLRYPAWLPAVESGLRRLRMAGWSRTDEPGVVYAKMMEAYDQLHALEPRLSAFHFDHFLTLVATMDGRDLFRCVTSSTTLPELLLAERARMPLRRLLKERGAALHAARRQLEAGLKNQDIANIFNALRAAVPLLRPPQPSEEWLLWIGRLWEADDPYEALDRFSRSEVAVGAELALAPAVLHLRDPQHFFPWNEAMRCGHATLEDGVDLGFPVAQRYQLFNEGVAWLCQQHRIHPFEVPAILPGLGETATSRKPRRFHRQTFRFLAARGDAPEPATLYRETDFCHDTYLDAAWLDRARGLLDLKGQLILQGVPGTGKTHLARCLARILTGGRDAAVRLVQFHPAYSYEEFVEGIKVRTTEVNGRREVTYPVEDGLLNAFAAEAARSPEQPFVLIIDEINRGNLPRIFGELLYLLEYREQSVRLPYSKRAFQLPANLYVLGTMNAGDRSVALLDQALRRRFSFLELAPDAIVLAAWLERHGSANAFTGRVVTLFERLNTRLRADLGPAYQVGHSYFMVDGLDEAKVRIIWQHQVRPLLEEYFAGHPAQLDAYDLDALWTKKPAKRRVPV